MIGVSGKACVLLAAALLAVPAMLQTVPLASGRSELFKTSQGATSVELQIQLPPGYNDTLAFTLPSESLVEGARFDLQPSPARIPLSLAESGPGLQNGSVLDNIVFDKGILRLSDLEGKSDFSAWQGNPVCHTAAAEGRLQLARDGQDMSFPKNIRVFASNQPEYDPAMAVAGDDSIYVAWTDQSEYDFNIYLARSTDRGESFQGAVRVNDNGTGKTRQESADVAAGPQKKVYVAWTDNRSGDEDIYIASSPDGGATFSSNRRVDDGVAGTNASYPSIAVSPSGKVAVAWEDARAGDKDVRCAFSDDGVSFGASVRINTDTSGREQLRPKVAPGNGQEFHAVWYDNRSGDFDIYYARSSGSGFLPERRVDDTGDAGTFQALPSVAVGPDERVHVVWHHKGLDGYRIMYSGSADGIVFSANLPASPVAGVGKDQFQPRVRVGADGTVHVVWHDRRNGYPDIFYANSTSGGKTFGRSFLVDDAPPDTLSYSPVLGVDSLGGVQVAWWDNRTRQGGFGTNFQIFHSRGGNPFFGSGTYLSPVLDLGAEPSGLSVAEARNETPPDTSLVVQLATSAGEFGPWSGFENISSVGSPSGPPPQRYVQWKVLLGAKDRSRTPSVSSLGLGFWTHPPAGMLGSRPITLPYALRSADVYLTEGRAGAGPASLSLELSANNGSTWQEARPGLPFEFSGAGRVLQYRIRFLGSSSSTPTLSSIYLDLRLETYTSDIRVTMGRSAVTVWTLPGPAGNATISSPDLQADFNRQIQEARRTSSDNATIRLNFSSATPGRLTVKNIRIAYDLPPVILSREPGGPASVSEGGSLAFGVTVLDPDNDALSSVWLLDGTRMESGTLGYTYRPDYTESGVHNLTVELSDGVLRAFATWFVSVADVNRPPVIQSTTPGDHVALGVREGATFELKATDPDGSPLEYGWQVAGRPAGSNDRTFDYVAPSSPGVFSVTVNVSDGRDSATHTWTVEVYKPADPPAPGAEFPVVPALAVILLALAAVLAVILFVKRPKNGRGPGRRRRRRT